MPNLSDPMAAVRAHAEAFNQGDPKALAATCADPLQILDGMAPHVWQGPTAIEDWYRDVLTEGEREGASGYRLTVGEPRHVNVTGDTAYVVVPTSMSFNVHGKHVSQTGSVFTVALRKVGAEWRLAAWAWAKGVSEVHARA
jgi:ketosteroid isomerase-like protein